MTNQIQTVSFHNQQILVLNHNNKPHVAVKPICENIGLDWDAQRKRINRDPVLNSTTVIMTAVAKDGKKREVLCLPLSMLNGWLFGINANRVRSELKEKVIQYQRECFDVLFNHFMPKVAQQFSNTISVQQQSAIQKAVNDRHHRTGEHWQAIYTKLHERFNVPRYQELHSNQFEEVMNWLGANQAQPIAIPNLAKNQRLLTLAEEVLKLYEEHLHIRVQLLLTPIDYSIRTKLYSLIAGLESKTEQLKLTSK